MVSRWKQNSVHIELIFEFIRIDICPQLHLQEYKMNNSTINLLLKYNLFQKLMMIAQF
jgi:hypothetical protein